MRRTCSVDLRLAVAHDVLELIYFLAFHKGEGAPRASRTPGTADAVHVVLVVLRDVIVEHRLHIVDIDTARRTSVDEADEMLNMGFREDIETVLEYIPNKDRQTILFSATMPQPIMEIARTYQQNAVQIRVVKKELTCQSQSASRL